MRWLEESRVTIDDEVRDEQAADAFGPVLRDFGSFYASELRQVVGLAYVISGSRSGAEDLAQDAFLAAYKRWEQVGRYPNPGAWVRRVVSNRAVSVFRRRAAEAKALLRFRGSESVVPEHSPDAAATWAAVRRLPKRQAQVIALRYYDGSSIADIARILECSENTVKTHLQRAKQTLNAQLTEREQS
ncbi:MAG: sigma-70 family RNA polymerase sigma factor [Acidimicrobiia bacterium]|nr:sigma-70 family RNA polymerase sigma factor [Acidimicrobiia bacterium]